MNADFAPKQPEAAGPQQPVEPGDAADIAAALQTFATAGRKPCFLADAVHFVLQVAPNLDSDKTIAQLFDEFMQAHVGHCRESTRESYAADFAVLRPAFGAYVPQGLRVTQVRQWLEDRRTREGKPLSVARKNSLLAFLRRLLVLGGIAAPLPSLSYRKNTLRDVAFFAPEEVVKILRCTPRRYRGFVAVLAFTGLRPSTLQALTSAHFRADAKEIQVPAKASKDNKPHLLEGHYTDAYGKVKAGIPEVLWAWLEAYPIGAVPVWRSLQKQLRRRLGRWITGGLRHTAATYFARLHGVQATARLLLDAEERLVRRHYIGLTRQAPAHRFFELTPTEVGDESPRGTWPSDQELLKLVWGFPLTKVAPMLGFSDRAVAKRCRRRAIPLPPHGHWLIRGTAGNTPASALLQQERTA